MTEELKQIYQLIDDILEDLKTLRQPNARRAEAKLETLKETIKHREFSKSQKELILKEKE